MPIYEYRCNACGHYDTSLEKINAAKAKTCPLCKKRQSFKRLVSAAGFQLKGQGWYATDFKNPPAKSAVGDKSDGKADNKSDGKSGDKSDSKTDNKSDGKSAAAADKKDKKAT